MKYLISIFATLVVLIGCQKVLEETSKKTESNIVSVEDYAYIGQVHNKVLDRIKLDPTILENNTRVNSDPETIEEFEEWIDSIYDSRSTNEKLFLDTLIVAGDLLTSESEIDTFVDRVEEIETAISISFLSQSEKDFLLSFSSIYKNSAEYWTEAWTDPFHPYNDDIESNELDYIPLILNLILVDAYGYGYCANLANTNPSICAEYSGLVSATWLIAYIG